jgi:hypothetical protein
MVCSTVIFFVSFHLEDLYVPISHAASCSLSVLFSLDNMGTGIEVPCHTHVSCAVANSSDVCNTFHSLDTWTFFALTSDQNMAFHFHWMNLQISVDKIKWIMRFDYKLWDLSNIYVKVFSPLPTGQLCLLLTWFH